MTQEDLKIKWCILENANATATLKQHAYVPKKRYTPYIGEEYIGNAQLCNQKGYCSDDGESAMKFDDIDYYTTEPSAGACKKCLKIYNTQTPHP